MIQAQTKPAQPGASTTLRRAFGSLTHRNLHVLFVLPALLVMVLLMAYPVIYTIVLSTRSYGLSINDFTNVGLQNYQKALADARFFDAFIRTVIFTVLSVTASIVVGMLIALALNRDGRGARWSRTMLILPMVATPVATSLIWMMMFNPTLGVLNFFLELVGLPPSLWVADPILVLPSIVMVDVWHFAPFAGLILLAGLKSLPHEPFESAIMDGASRWQLFWQITLPLLRPVLLVVLVFRTIDALKVFDLIWVMTAGGPGFNSETLYIYAYNHAFKYLDLGYGSAVIVLFTLIVAVISAAWIILRDRSWEGKGR
jgi:multiple sugar transport system permease protein